ncbi:conserved hypothetical protein [delta proteobacterium NaphS2]|nr:conserved hypothetical protein [delta proteobacterium NaphS2]
MRITTCTDDHAKTSLRSLSEIAYLSFSYLARLIITKVVHRGGIFHSVLHRKVSDLARLDQVLKHNFSSPYPWHQKQIPSWGILFGKKSLNAVERLCKMYIFPIVFIRLSTRHHV